MRALFALTLVSFAFHSLALQLPVQRRAMSTSNGFSASVKSPAVNSSDNSGNVGIINLSNNLLYVANVTVGGIVMEVQLDTGSDDLWVLPEAPIPNLNVSAKTSVPIVYAIGSVIGPVAFAEVSMGPHTVSSQAFVNATNVTAFDTSFFPIGVRGTIGLSPAITTSVFEEVDLKVSEGSAAGKPFLQNVFAQDPSSPDFLSVLLGRTDDLEDVANGIFSISEYIESYENITDAPHVPHFQDPDDPSFRWSAFIDDFKVNGASQNLTSNIQSVPSGKAIAVFDTGATDAFFVDPALCEAIYGQVPGAVFEDVISEWLVPCTAELPNVTITISGLDYPVHPLDLTSIVELPIDGVDGVLCTGSYRPSEFNPKAFSFDMLLGDAFMRNVYAVFNFGTHGGTQNLTTENATIQFLSLTDPDTAFSDFHKSRPKTLQSYPPEFSPDQIKKAFSSDDNDDDGSADAVSGASSVSSSSPDAQTSSISNSLSTYGPVIIGLLGENVLISIVLCAIALSVCIRKGGKSRSVRQDYAPVAFKEESRRAEDEVIAARYGD